jgi:hypothetical protein
MLLGMPFFSFSFVITISSFFRNTWREITRYIKHLFGGCMECTNSWCRNFATDVECRDLHQENMKSISLESQEFGRAQ